MKKTLLFIFSALALSACAAKYSAEDFTIKEQKEATEELVCVTTGMNVVCIKYCVCLNPHTRQFVIQIRNVLFATRNNNRTENNSVCRLQF